MKRLVLIGLTLAVGACIPRPPTPPNPPTPHYDLTVMMRDGRAPDTTPIPSGVMTVRSATVNVSQTANTDGYVLFPQLVSDTYHVCGTATGFVDQCDDVAVTSPNIRHNLILQPFVPPPLPWRTGEALLTVAANFCNLTDAKGRVIFTPALLSMWMTADGDGWHDWIGRLLAAGSTHVFVSPQFNYVPSPFAPVDIRNNPSMFHGFLTALLREGLSPVVFLSGAGEGQSEIDTYWPGLLGGIQDLWPNVILIPAWEPIPGTKWTPQILSYAMQTITRLAPTAVMAFHSSPDRWTGVGKDDSEGPDPWNHDEAAFWTSNGGENLKMIFYETNHGGYVIDVITQWNADQDVFGVCGSGTQGNPTNLDRWVNRLAEGLYRSGQGHCGWRPVRVVIAETVAYDIYNNRGVPEDARRVATDGLRVCRIFGIACTFGNGIPR